jgi:hypothetical protein
MDAAAAALIGAAIGALGSVAGVWLQQRHQTRRERLKVAADLGLADYNSSMELVKKNGGAMVPLSAWVAYHAEFMDALAEGTLSPPLVAKLNDRHDALMNAFPDAHKGKGP